MRLPVPVLLLVVVVVVVVVAVVVEAVVVVVVVVGGKGWELVKQVYWEGWEMCLEHID